MIGFIDPGDLSESENFFKVAFQVLIHITFIISAWALAITDRISSTTATAVKAAH